MKLLRTSGVRTHATRPGRRQMRAPARVAAPRSLAWVVALFLLLLAAQAQFGLTLVGRVWWAILSWDSPATHAFEQSASCTPPYVDPARHLRDGIAVAATAPAAPGWSPDAPAPADPPSRSGDLIRSPPAA